MSVSDNDNDNEESLKRKISELQLELAKVKSARVETARDKSFDEATWFIMDSDCIGKFYKKITDMLGNASINKVIFQRTH